MRSPFAQAALRLNQAWQKLWRRWNAVSRRLTLLQSPAVRRSGRRRILELVRLETRESPSDSLSVLLGQIPSAGALDWLSTQTPVGGQSALVPGMPGDGVTDRAGNTDHDLTFVGPRGLALDSAETGRWPTRSTNEEESAASTRR